MKLKTHNVVIKDAQITSYDGMLTAWLRLDYGDSSRGFGGFVLYMPYDRQSCAGHFIWRVMEIAGVDEWDHLPGKAIRARADEARVYEIGHIFKDDWFRPMKELK